MKISDIGCNCFITGGGVFEYKISAQISNLAVDVLPSRIDIGEISFTGESNQKIVI